MQNLITNLYSAYNQLNEKLFSNELPEVIITIQSSPKTKNKIIYGWASKMPCWSYKGDKGEEIFKYELNIVAEQLCRPYSEVIATLIHEMCHIYNSQRGIEDCSSRGNHKTEFKEVAERVGLLVEKRHRTGWSQTMLSDNLLETVNNLNVDKSSFRLYKTDIEKPKKSRTTTPTYKYICPKCGKEIKSKESNLAVLCQDCDVQYEKKN
jgi:hypothetical protein